ncbi:MAG: hypothetical protein IE917_10800 [Betaproteobacteria bacterium]|nr:hypothetical protein [Betaproteobacteria bacterium]
MKRGEDTLHKAWLLRCRIHAWLLANPDGLLKEIDAAMPDVEYETIRSAIARMRKYGCVTMTGNRRTARYRAVGTNAGDPDEVRQRMRQVGKDRGQENLVRRDPVSGRFKPPVYKTIHRSNGPCIPSQRGQGALGSGRRGASSLAFGGL